MLNMVALASRVQDRFRQVQHMSVIEEEIISILNHVRFNIGLSSTNIPEPGILVYYLAVGHFFESHPGNVDWILSMTCIICM